jgi:radical SAM superfamily enzyme YgiQ (UPF0313 family)
LLYQIVSKIENVYPDLAYLPPPKDADLFIAENVPWLLGTTSKREARDFGLIALSLSIVQELLNIAPMMKRSALPLGKRERMLDESIPLIILGGASALYTSALFNENPIVDGIFIGSDAGAIHRLFSLCRDFRLNGLPKKETLARLSEVPGFFEPDGKRSIKALHTSRLLPEQLLESGPVLYDENVIGKGNLQLSEGCACFCSFCAESFSRKPYREFDIKTLLSAAAKMKASMGVDDLELYSFNFSMYREFYKILWELSARFPSIGLKSQRFDSIAFDPELVKCLHAVGKSSITCGIEGISPRLRNYLHKSLSELDLKKSLHVLLSSPLREIKIFLIATGLELDDDYKEFRALLQYMQTVLAASERRPRIIFSATILVRFPWTPLEFEDAPAPSICRKAMQAVEKVVHEASFEFRASASESDYWLSQTLVRAANPNVGAAFLEATEETGYIYYREVSPEFIAIAKKHLTQKTVSEASMLKAVLPQNRHDAPWSELHIGIDESFLIRQWESACKFIDNGYCMGTQKKSGTCLECSACDDPASVATATASPAPRSYSASHLKDRVLAAQSRTFELRFKMTLGPFFRGLPRKMAGLALARALMLCDSAFIDAYRSYGSSALGVMFSSDWVLGSDVLTLRWDNTHKAALEKKLMDPGFIACVNTKLEHLGIFYGLATGDCSTQLKLSINSPFPFDLSGFARSSAIKFMTRRIGPDLMQYEISKDSLKKKVLLDCFSRQLPENNTEVTCTPGKKFNADMFAQTAFVLPNKHEWVRIEMRAMAMDPLY